MHQKLLQLSQSFCQRIKTINLLANTLPYKHPHFSDDFNKVERIRDCTEHWVQRLSNPKAQDQTHSTYKSHNSVKKLVIYIPETYAGSA